jgi:hypothetical protein
MAVVTNDRMDVRPHAEAIDETAAGERPAADAAEVAELLRSSSTARPGCRVAGGNYTCSRVGLWQRRTLSRSREE